MKKVFNKGYLPGWSDQVYTVSRIIRTPKIEEEFSGPVQYIIRDYNGEDISGAFYGFELQKVAPPERFRVKEVLSRELEQETVLPNTSLGGWVRGRVQLMGNGYWCN